MDQSYSWPRPYTPPSLPVQGWQKQGSSLSIKELHTNNHGVQEPQVASQTPTQKLVAGLDPTKIQEVAASQVAITEMYYTTSLHHAQRLFRWALITAGVGLVFFLVAVGLQVLQEPVYGALISLASGGVLAVLAVLNFCLYGRIFNQCRAFHERLDRTQQYLLANSICENLHGEVKQATQIELIRTMMHSLAMQEEKMDKGK